MRKLVFVTVVALTLAASAYWSAGSAEEGIKVRLVLVDSQTGDKVSGIVRVRAGKEPAPMPLPGMFQRLLGLAKQQQELGWYVVPVGGVETTLPRAELSIEALSGLETALTRQPLD